MTDAVAIPVQRRLDAWGAHDIDGIMPCRAVDRRHGERPTTQLADGAAGIRARPIDGFYEPDPRGGQRPDRRSLVEALGEPRPIAQGPLARR